MIREEECTPSSSWWEDVQHQHQHHHNDHVSTSFYHKHTIDPDVNVNTNANANARCDVEDSLSISMANPSNHLGLTTIASSSHELFQDHVISSHNHPWNLIFLPSRSLGDQMMDDHHHNRHHHHHIPTSSNSSEVPFEPTNGNGNVNGWMYNTNQVRYDESNEQRLSKLPDHVGKYWSIALPNNPDMIYDHDSQTNNNIYNRSSQGLEVKSEKNLSYNNNGLSVSGLMLNELRNINDSFKPCFKDISLSEFTKKDNQRASQAMVKSATTNARKKKRNEEISDEVNKKAKCDGDSILSPEKLELPKAKLREKITTLQQIVSPFGKTDTASVLQETITYVNFYQEQIKLLSTPYMKNSSIKDDGWGGWEREEERRERKHLDLRSRGLCLVPICYTPISYHHNHHDHHHHHRHHHHHHHHTPNHYWSPSSTPSFHR